MKNREFKFRIWSKSSNNFQDAFEESWDQYELYSSPRGLFKESLDLISDSENYIIQQFTGLFDRNNNEIYEGDIFNTKAARWQVTFSHGSFWAEVVWSQVLPKEYVECLFIMTEEMIPLGNILENPELLTLGDRL